jgi:hypothetical protein
MAWRIRLGCSDSVSSPRTGVEAILTELGPETQNRRYAVSGHKPGKARESLLPFSLKASGAFCILLTSRISLCMPRRSRRLLWARSRKMNTSAEKAVAGRGAAGGGRRGVGGGRRFALLLGRHNASPLRGGIETPLIWGWSHYELTW